VAYLGQNCRFCQKLGLGAVYFGLFLSSANGKAYSAKSIRSMLAGGPAQAPTDSKQLTERSTLLATVGAPRWSNLGCWPRPLSDQQRAFQETALAGLCQLLTRFYEEARSL
jgi:hypothetical protein